MKYAGNTYYFAANVKGTDTASGQDARNLTMDILSGIQKAAALAVKTCRPPLFYRLLFMCFDRKYAASAVSFSFIFPISA